MRADRGARDRGVTTAVISSDGGVTPELFGPTERACAGTRVARVARPAVRADAEEMGAHFGHDLPIVVRRVLVPALMVSAIACSHASSAIDVRPADLRKEPGWIMIEDVPFVKQHGDSDCGAAALAMVFRHLGEEATLDQILSETETPRGQALRAGDMKSLAKKHGYEAFLFSGKESDFDAQLRQGRPIIVGLVKPASKEPVSHYEVVVGYNPARHVVLTLDPARGWRSNDWNGFVVEWAPSRQLALVVIPRARPAVSSPLGSLALQAISAPE
jgi:hypothetical protein